MLKVAIILEGFSIGGAQRVVSELVSNIDQNKIQLLVICTGIRENTDLEKNVESNVTVKYLGLSGKNLVRNYICVARVLKKFGPDVIHAHLLGQLYSVPYGLLHRIPVIITAHTKPEKAFINKILFLIKYGIKHKKIWIVSVSEENQLLVTKYFSSSKGQCVCINNGINTKAFYKKKHSVFTFINVARQDENKNQIAIIRCFKKIFDESKACKLILVGDGVCHEKLKKAAFDLKIDEYVDFPGAIGNVKDYYAVSDVYVQSSHREAMPMSVLEALATGLPIISTNVGGLHDVVNKNGFLVPDGNEEELYSAMKKILEISFESIDRMGKESMKISSYYSSEKMARLYMNLYFSVVNKNENFK